MFRTWFPGLGYIQFRTEKEAVSCVESSLAASSPNRVNGVEPYAQWVAHPPINGVEPYAQWVAHELIRLLGVESFIPAAMVISEVAAKRSARMANPVRWRRYLSNDYTVDEKTRSSAI